jgi:hypothetical protein
MPSDQAHKEQRSRLPSINKLLLACARFINKREQLNRRNAARKYRIAPISNSVRRDADQATRLGDYITNVERPPRITRNSTHLAIIFGRSRAYTNPGRPLTRETVQHALICTDRHFVHESNHVDRNVA